MPARKKVQTPMMTAGAYDSDDDLATAGTNGTEQCDFSTSCTDPLSDTSRTVVERVTTKTMPKPAKKTSTKRKAAAATPRVALKDRTNLPDLEVAEDIDDDEISKPKVKRARTVKVAHEPKVMERTEVEVIPETQQEVDQEEHIEPSIEIEEQDRLGDMIAIHARQPPVLVRRAGSASVSLEQARGGSVPRSASVRPTPAVFRERSTSVNAVGRERVNGDPELRRKLAELTKEHESISLKYRNLQEIGQDQAETNFEKLKRAADQRLKDANELIASLKKELAEVRRSNSSDATETTALQMQVTTLHANNEELKSQNEDLTQKIDTAQTETNSIQKELKEKLLAAQNETRAVEAKLIAARQQITTIQETKTLDKTIARSGPSSISEAQKEARMKENLYTDLTGLIIRGVKRKDGEDEYDCLQTGRNGTLHFHLSVGNDSAIANPKTPSGLSYEDAEFAYEPFLDESRDRELMGLLPDYLTEEICFPRCHAIKFYTKVVECMTKKIVVDED